VGSGEGEGRTRQGGGGAVNDATLTVPPPSLQAQQISAQLQRLAEHLPGIDVEELVAREPNLLLADVGALLGEVARLMPGRDAVAFLADNPRMVLDMDSSGLPSSLETDGVGQAQ
jgi:hypothetical protein